MKLKATQALHAYWDRLRAGRSAPERADLDPGAIRTLLGDVFILEAAADARHAVRLAGTRICTLLGREWRRRPFAQPFAADEWPDLHSLLAGVCVTATPAVAGVVGETRDGRRLNLELLLLPLRHRGRTDARLLGSLTAENWPYWAGLMPLERLRLVSMRHLTPETLPVRRDGAAPSLRPALGALRLVRGGRI